MVKASIVFVGHLAGHQMPDFLRSKKDDFLDKNKEMCISVVSSVTNKPHEIAQKIKGKRVSFMVFEDNIPQEVISNIKNSVKKICNGKSPEFKTNEDLLEVLALATRSADSSQICF